jgi:hypothetical protein
MVKGSVKDTEIEVVPAEELKSWSTRGWNIKGDYNPRTNLIRLSRQAQRNPNTLMHELGHSTWVSPGAIPEKQKGIWYKLHNEELKKKGFRKSHPAIKRYAWDASHSFAEVLRYYANQPGEMQQNNPDFYNYFRDLLGFEYSRGLKNDD